jgi:tRNA-2-methylthio-N6-dimethylallyladenosine synthase
VRKKSEEKLYSYLGRLASLKEKKKIIIGVVGCVAQLYKSELLEKRPFIDFVLGPDNYSQLREVILSSDEEKFISTRQSREFQEIPPHLLCRVSAVSSYVTIMEGCNNFCSYCIVPFARGREKFRPMKNILEEVQYLADKGYKEIQLLGQNVNSYQDPETGKDFSELLREVNRVGGIEWIKFITSHPKNFNEKIAAAMKEAKKVCRQLHLPIQSGSSTVLKRMNRGYTKEDYLEKISILRNLMPDISLSTDIIVGFPGETEEEFQETMSLLREVHYTNIFSFRYSPRPLTAASEEKDTISFEEKKRRLTLVQQLQKELQLELHKSLVGRVMKVLCLGKSKKDSDLFSGRNEGYQVVNFKSKNDVIGRFVDVRITSFGPYSLIGEKIP